MAYRVTGLFCLISLLLVDPLAAHFLLNYPPTIGFDDSLESNPPCGSFSPNFSKDNVTDFHVGGDSLALTSIHPQATWLFRATLDQTASGNWTALRPAIQQTGLGAFCEPDVTVPSTFAGSKGVLQIIQDAPDGILYQCAAVSFVASSGKPPSVCTNVTGLTAKYTQDAKLSAIPATATATVASGTATGLTTSTSKPSAAMSVSPFGEVTMLLGVMGVTVVALFSQLFL